MNRVCFVVLFVLCTALAASRSADAQPKVTPPPPAQPNGKEKPAPRAFVLSFENYAPPHAQLKHTVNNAVDLAIGLDRLKYQVQFATDVGSLKAVQAKLKPESVQAFKTGKEIGEEIRAWLAAASKAQAPLAVVVLCGHGEERSPVAESGGVQKPGGAVLLGPDDKAGEGGVSVADIGEAAAAFPSLRVVVVYDACRKPMKNIQPAAQQAAPAESAVIKGARRITSSPYANVTVLYATAAGENTDDRKDDLTSALARGLRYDARMKEIVSRVADRRPVPTDVMLLHWFGYGIEEVLWTTKLRQLHEIQIGSQVPLESTVVYSIVGGAPKVPQQIESPVDLLDQFVHADGDFQVATTRLTGVTVRRPVNDPKAGINVPINRLYSSSWLRQPSEAVGPVPGGVDVKGQLLELKVVASYDAKGKGMPPTKLSFEPHPVYFDAKAQRTTFLSRIEPCSLAFNQLYRVSVPLQQIPDPADNKNLISMNSFAVRAPNGAPITWPEGAALTITALRLVPRAKNQPLGATEIVLERQDAIKLWHILCREDESLMVGRTPLGALQFVVKDGKACRQGGDLQPPVYAPPSSVLEVVAKNPGAKAAELAVELGYLEKDSEKGQLLTANKPIPLPPGKTVTMAVPLTETGYGNYLAFTTNGNVEVLSATIKPGPKNN
jgi:hypothetical protein